MSAQKIQSLVVKVGGEVVADAAMRKNLTASVAALARAGNRVVIVHGGGPQATALQKRLGQEPQLVGGRRVTDAETLEVMKRAVAGQVNVDLVAALCAAGVSALGLSGVSSSLVRARKRRPVVVTGAGPEPIDLGHVGDVVSVNVELLMLLCGTGYVPVIACLGADVAGAVYNINADIVAGEIAAAIAADRLLHLTSTAGVLRDVADPKSRIPRLSAAEARAAIAEGAIGGGMIPKVEESLVRLDGRIGAIHILSAATPGGLEAEVGAPGSVGTVLVRA